MDEKKLRRGYEEASVEIAEFNAPDVIVTSVTASGGPQWGSDVSDGGWTG